DEGPFDLLLAAVAVEQGSAAGELRANGFDRSPDLGTLRVEQARPHDAQGGGVQLLGPGVHEETAPLRRPALLEDERAHLLGFAAPGLRVLRGQLSALDEAQRPLEAGPGGQL